MKVLALDIGDVRIGLATSDSLGIIASGYETYTRQDEIADILYLKNFIEKNAIELVVIGLPINMDGTHGERVNIVKKFANKLLEQISIEVVFQDERLTTVQAERMLINHGVRREKRKQIIDKVAATIILQAYLDAK
ncbi:MAG: Holliday junction resolvase RuvX [Christensenellales bacterium]|jgi:putative Holliday junction resolvase|nr:Holliday junction resolvase RuvX [Clostridiales bacterium]